MSTEDDMWQDYDHYMHTGELSEYFEDEYEDECVSDVRQDNNTNSYCDDLDEVIRYLKQLKKENERIIKEEKKKEKAKKKLEAQKNKSVQKESIKDSVVHEKEIGNTKVESVKQETEPKSKIIDQPIFYIFLALIVLLFILLIYK
jgi:DNA repair exonuclease SbcCD ATPase subunit